MDINKLLESTWPGFGNINVQEMLLYMHVGYRTRPVVYMIFLKGTGQICFIYIW